ncbi:AraC family transcriptional regulator [Simiduia sp. 21SJ11W-1]|uniref:AraC family transcriptional regulator n=1 Tax=Simiduia sp. 21SJ11W-1 TaxID=2909669 RepID=UPI0020A22961|nr:AraC family transcriptional regulator [Simiduia sp. 21SJ11W-1]UTA47705.1 AraC family transcriptional regulator [Simiduia sp. 21SJ11W-1]
MERLAAEPLTCQLYPRALGFYPVARGHQMQRELHDDHLLLYCTAGAGTLTLGEARYAIAAGDVVIIPAGRAHHYCSDHQRPWTVYWVHFAGALAQAMSEWLAASAAPVKRLGLNARLLALFDAQFSLREQGSNWDAAVHACHQLQFLLSHIAQMLGRAAESAGRLDIARIKGVMMAHIHDHIDLDALAADAALSKYHFAKVFKAQTGQSPIHYFIELKMQQACYLLDTSRQSIKQVALNLGYEDAYYFSRLFKKVMGVSPARYRAGLHNV